MMRTVTIKEVAEKAGVTSSTVSKALSDHSDIAQKTKARIRKIAAECNYVPNALASSLGKLNKGSYYATIAVFLGHEGKHPLVDHPIYQSILDGVRERAEQVGFSVNVIWLYDPDFYGRNLNEILEHRGVSAIIPIRVKLSPFNLDWSKYVLCNAGRVMRTSPDEFIHCTTCDMYSTMFRLLQALSKKGVKSVGYIVKGLYDQLHHEGRMLAAYREYGFQEKTMRLAPHLLGSDLENQNGELEKEALRKIDQWFDEYRPECIIFNRLGLYPSLEKRMQQVAKKIGVPLKFVSLDISHKNETGMRVPYREIGAASVDMLATMLGSNDFGLPEENQAKQFSLYAQWNGGDLFPEDGA